MDRWSGTRGPSCWAPCAVCLWPRPLRDALGALLRRCTAIPAWPPLGAGGGRSPGNSRPGADGAAEAAGPRRPAVAAGLGPRPLRQARPGHPCVSRLNPDGFFYAYVARLDAYARLPAAAGHRPPRPSMTWATCRRLSKRACTRSEPCVPSGKLPASQMLHRPVPQPIVCRLWSPGLRHFLYKPLDIPDHHRQLPQFTRWPLPWVLAGWGKLI